MTSARAVGYSLFGGVALLCATSVVEASPSARLVYGRTPEADECPDEAKLRQAVGARIGYDPFFPHAARTVVVTISRKDKRLTARIELVDDAAHTGGARELSTTEPGCEELFESTALAVAIAIDPRSLIAPAASPTPVDPRPEPVSPEPLPTTAAEASVSPRPIGVLPPPTKPLRIRVGVDVRGAAGLQPNVAPGVFLVVGLMGRRAAVTIEGGSYLPTAAAGPVGGEAHAWLVSGALVPCLRFEPLKLCEVLKAGRFEASGSGVTDARTEAVVFLAAGARVGVELVAASPVRIHLDGELLGNLARTTLRVGEAEVWKASPVAGGMSAGASFDFE